MPRKEVVFADRATNVSVLNGLVRIDFGSFTGAEKTGDGAQRLTIEPTHQLVMPLDGFVAAVGMLDKTLKQLLEVERKRRETAAAAAAPAPADAQEGAASG